MINWIGKKSAFLEFGWVRFHSWIPRQTKATETKCHSPNWILFALWSCKTRWKTSTNLIRSNKFPRQCCERRFLITVNSWQRGGGGGGQCRETSWRPPWTYNVLLYRLSYSKITKDVSASRPLINKTSIASTRKESALNRSMVDHGIFFILCWYSCFVPQLGIPTSLQFFGKKEKRNTVQR